MQLQQLAYFVAVADVRHFTRAADRLDVAQPTLSQQIGALERSLGTRLFSRTPGNVELTAAGQELLPIARRMLADADNARRALRELADLRRGQVRLGATPSLCTGLVPKIIGEYHRQHPGVAIVITESGSRDLQGLVADGSLDLALLVDSRAEDDPRLVTEPLFVEELVVISSSDAPPPTSRARLRIADLRTKQLVMFREGYDLRETTLGACRAAGFEPTFAVEGGEMDAVLGFVAAGLGLAVVPSTVVSDRFRVTRLAAPGLVRTVQVARRSDVELSRAAAELARAIGTYAVTDRRRFRRTSQDASRSRLWPGRPPMGQDSHHRTTMRGPRCQYRCSSERAAARQPAGSSTGGPADGPGAVRNRTRG